MTTNSKTWQYRGRVIEEDNEGADGRMRKNRTGYVIQSGDGRRYEPGKFATLAEAKKEIDAMLAAAVPGLVRVPAKFYNDHDERGCEPFCEPVDKSSRFVYLRLDDPGLDELLDDAKHYSDTDQFGEWGRENRTMCKSAAATVAAIEAARKAGGAA